ncbi:MAG: hypothetical protein HY669_03860 [Chloroflexi bacterium]|nr:hypothetical protein [Chloroflexota bacterium]
MWVQVKTASNLLLAEMWKELFEGEGIPTRLLADPDKRGGGELTSYQVLVPSDKVHVVEEVLRKV